MGENPWPSYAWREPQIKAIYEGEGAAAHGYVCSWTSSSDDQQAIEEANWSCRRPTSGAEVCHTLQVLRLSLGSYKENGKTKSVASYATGYTLFAKRVVMAAEEFLDVFGQLVCIELLDFGLKSRSGGALGAGR